MRALAILSIVAIGLTILCGLWMKWGPGPKDANFHALLSFGTLLLCLVTIILFMARK
ncbi:hypothetical protein [Gorillibacterium sp. sgz500922]|uniref:hypothetical protein n=1 Tax=Gorillibacterium sp. sgz500922 TaxID=3446694 RepID=UPI003F66E403